jgi:cytochrome c oxidase cbb3-type subunit II
MNNKDNPAEPKKNGEHKKSLFYDIEKSALISLIGIIFLFSFSVAIVLILPRHVDPTWSQPSSRYQVQMYEIADPNFYISSSPTGDYNHQFVYHLKRDFTLLSFQETDVLRIFAPSELKPYITAVGDPVLKLTSKLLLLRKPVDSALADQTRKQLQDLWEKDHPQWKEKGMVKPDFDILELYEHPGQEAFGYVHTDGILENWASKNFKIMDASSKQPFHAEEGVFYINCPMEYRVSYFTTLEGFKAWRYDPNGQVIATLDELKGPMLGFMSRKELILEGEHIYAIEGCWYCHTDQTRTLVQDVVLNGNGTYPAPPSSANEYIYQKITFPGTRRIGPDLSRTGVKRPSRDWHKGHFWSPTSASKGSIMPAFKHFFDFDPRGTSKIEMGIPNYRFEAIYQYLMTKGTRIFPPTEAWWLGKDPIQTIEIIEGRKKVP